MEGIVDFEHRLKLNLLRFSFRRHWCCTVGWAGMEDVVHLNLHKRLMPFDILNTPFLQPKFCKYHASVFKGPFNLAAFSRAPNQLPTLFPNSKLLYYYLFIINLYYIFIIFLASELHLYSLFAVWPTLLRDAHPVEDAQKTQPAAGPCQIHFLEVGRQLFSKNGWSSSNILIPTRKTPIVAALRFPPIFPCSFGWSRISWMPRRLGIELSLSKGGLRKPWITKNSFWSLLWCRIFIRKQTHECK